MTNQPFPTKPKTRHPQRKPAARPAPEDRRDLQVEIDVLRTGIDCMSEKIDAAGDLPEQLRLLDGLGKAATRLAALVKMQKLLSQDSEDYLTGLSRLLAETNEKLRREGVHE
jgi:hypothetical protein